MIQVLSRMVIVFTALQATAGQHEGLANAVAFTLNEQALERYLKERIPENTRSLSQVRSEFHYAFDEDGRYDYTNYSMFVIENETGLYELSQLSISYRPWFESQPTVKARVFTDGQFIQLDQKTLVESSISQSGLSYSDVKILHIPLENLQIGSVVELEIQVNQHLSSYRDGVAMMHPLLPAYPTEFLEVSISIPLEGTYKVGLEGQTLQNLQTTQEVQKDHRVYQYRAKSLAPAPITINARIPDVIKDPTLVVSSGKSWQAIARSYAALVDIKASELTQDDLDKLLPVSGDRLGNILKAVKYMNNKIRYTANDLGQSTLHPDSPLTVIERQYGDCKDQATLLVAMLRKMGVSAHVALLSASDQAIVAENYPGISLFNHAIVYLPDDDIWIDPTQPSEDLTRIPLADQGRLSLIAEKSTVQLTRTPSSQANTNLNRRVVDIFYSDYEGAKVVDARTYRGDIYDALVPIETEKTEKIREQLSTFVTSRLAGEPTNFEVEESARTSTVTMTMTSMDSKMYGITRYGSNPRLSTDSILELLPIQFSDEFEQLRKQLLIANTANPDAFIESEKQPIYIGSLSSSEVIERFHIPTYMEWTTTPRDFELAGPVVRYVRTSTVSDNTLEVTTVARLNKHIVTSQDLETERENYRLFKGMMNQMASFQSIPAKLLTEGKAKDAFAMHKKLVAESPYNVMHLIRYSEDLERIGLRQVARDLTTNAIKSFPESAVLQNELGNNWLKGDYAGFHTAGSNAHQAILHFRKAIDLDADDVYSLYGFAVAELENQALFTDDKDHYQSVAKTLSEGMERYRNNMRNRPGIYSGANLNNLLYSVINYTAMSYLLADEPENVKKFLSNWGMGNDQSKSFFVAAEALHNGIDAAWAAAGTAGTGNPVQLVRNAINHLIAIEQYDLVSKMIDSDLLTDKQGLPIDALKLVTGGSDCLNTKNDIHREVWDTTFGLSLDRKINASSYPAEIAGTVNQPYLDRFMHNTRGAITSRVRREYMKCFVSFDIREIGNLVLVDEKQFRWGMLFYRVEGILYILTDSLQIPGMSRVLDFLERSGKSEERTALLNWYFQPWKRATNLITNNLRQFERKDDIPANDLDFYAALIHSAAHSKRNDVVAILKDPPRQFGSRRYKRALRQHIIASLPEERHEETLALLNESFEDSDQLEPDWWPIFNFHLGRSEINELNQHLQKYREEFGSTSKKAALGSLYLKLAENNYDELIKSANQMIVDGTLDSPDMNEPAWRLFKKNVHLEDALNLLLEENSSNLKLSRAITNTIATLQASTGKPLKAFTSLVKSKEGGEYPMLDSWDMLILALTAEYLGYEQYRDKLVSRMQMDPSEELEEILQRFTSDELSQTVPAEK